MTEQTPPDRQPYVKPPRAVLIALSDPGSITPRRFDLGPENDATEPLTSWQARALADAGLLLGEESAVRNVNRARWRNFTARPTHQEQNPWWRKWRGGYIAGPVCPADLGAPPPSVTTPCCDDGPAGHTQQEHHDASPCYDQACPMEHPNASRSVARRLERQITRDPQ